MIQTPITAAPHFENATVAGVVTGAPAIILRVEGAAVLAAATVAYANAGSGWTLFALLFLVPDLSMLGYLRGPRLGAALYNSGHSTLAPAALLALGLIVAKPLAVSLGLIWLAHIGFDRLMGYGLKYPSGFKHTHLWRG